MMSYSITSTETFTVVHARHMSSKVAADLMRFRDFYGAPSEALIDLYEEELIELLRGDYLDHVTYGFQRQGKFVEALQYRAKGGALLSNDDPGSLRPKPDIEGLPFTSFLVRNERWWQLQESQRALISERVRIKRTNGQEPDTDGGYWQDDLTYSAGGRGVSRRTFRRW